MALLSKINGSLVYSALVIAACSPLQVVVFDDESEPTPMEEAPPPVVFGLGGHMPVGEGMGGSSSLVSFLLDDFEDGDQKANDPGGWWYIVNDGTGTQELAVVDSALSPVSPGNSSRFVLKSAAQNFSEWGAALGVDIEDVVSGQNGLEVRFKIASAEVTEVAFHALDGTGTHFSRNVISYPEWSEIIIRTNELFVVDGTTVRGFDVPTATELQWFVFTESPTTIWLDDVWLTYW